MFGSRVLQKQRSEESRRRVHLNSCHAGFGEEGQEKKIKAAQNINSDLFTSMTEFLASQVRSQG